MAEHTEKYLLTPLSTAQYTSVKPSTAQYSPLHHSRAQYTTVQPSTAQYSPAQPTTTSTGESIPPCIHLFTVQTIFCTEAPWSCYNTLWFCILKSLKSLQNIPKATQITPEVPKSMHLGHIFLLGLAKQCFSTVPLPPPTWGKPPQILQIHSKSTSTAKKPQTAFWVSGNVC